MCWFPVNSGLLGVVFPCYQGIWKSYLAFLLDLLGKLDASILFVQVFMEFIDRKKYLSFCWSCGVFLFCSRLKSSLFGLCYSVELLCNLVSSFASNS